MDYSEVIILVDNSSSMGVEDLDTGSRRELLLSKLREHLPKLTNEARRFGLAQFNSVNPFDFVVPFGPHDTSEIYDYLSEFPAAAGRSPLGDALGSALAEYGWRGSIILCFTDGESNTGQSVDDLIKRFETTSQKRSKARLVIVGIGPLALERRIEFARLTELYNGAFVSVRTDQEARSSVTISEVIDVGFGLLLQATPMVLLASRVTQYEIEIERLSRLVGANAARIAQLSASAPEQTQAVAQQVQAVAGQIDGLKGEISSVRDAGKSLTQAVTSADRKARMFSFANGALLLGFTFLFVVIFLFLNAQYSAALTETQSILEEVRTIRALREAPL